MVGVNTMTMSIFIVLIVFVVFLVLREFWCWYWKINKLISLMQEQNDLLKRHFNKTITTGKFIPTHKVKLLTKAEGLGLRIEPNAKIDTFIKLPDGTEVQHVSTGDDVTLLDKKGRWFEIRTKDDVCGWCFSGSLEKIEHSGKVLLCRENGSGGGHRN
jgi:hypothetical protein